MNSEHFFTFIWLRWRLLVRQVQRAGLKNGVLLGIVAVILVLGVLFFTVASFLLGLFLVPKAPAEKLPAIIMYVWDVIIVCLPYYLGVGADCRVAAVRGAVAGKVLAFAGVAQRRVCGQLPQFAGEPDHGPVFPDHGRVQSGRLLQHRAADAAGAAVAGGVFADGHGAVSYQFQGWLASLMVNKRRRRTVIVVATLVFVLLCQVPNLLNFMRVWDGPKREKGDVPLVADAKKQEADKERDDELFQEAKQTVVFINMGLPPGWLALGAMAAAEGSVWPALLGIVGMGLIGAGSLRRAYRTTVRLYTGEFTARKPAAGRGTAAGRKHPLPWRPGSGPAAAAATCSKSSFRGCPNRPRSSPWRGFRSLMRAPEAKMTAANAGVSAGHLRSHDAFAAPSKSRMAYAPTWDCSPSAFP